MPAAVAIFLAIATNVYLSMVLRPRMNYFRMKVGSFDSAAAGRSLAPALRPAAPARRPRSCVLGWIAAAAGLVLWP